MRQLRGEPATAPAVSFVTLGDWGGAVLGDYHRTDEIAVAKTLSASAAKLGAQFLVNVGDSHYYYGVKSATDPAWQTNFEDVFTDESLAIPWYSVLGNRELFAFFCLKASTSAQRPPIPLTLTCV